MAASALNADFLEITGVPRSVLTFGNRLLPLPPPIPPPQLLPEHHLFREPAEIIGGLSRSEIPAP